MNLRDQTIKYVAILNEATQTEEVRWTTTDPPSGFVDDDRQVGAVFKADFRGKTIRLFEAKIRRTRTAAEVSFTTGSLFYSQLPPQLPLATWVNRVFLQIVDYDGKTTLFTFPGVPGLEELLDTVRIKTSGVTEYLEEILAGESDKADKADKPPK